MNTLNYLHYKINKREKVLREKKRNLIICDSENLKTIKKYCRCDSESAYKMIADYVLTGKPFIRYE